ncbi:MAG: retroviral-like aspartic protease family protein [Cyclobacteriaceae bacterium]|nr:retroviral-like aspartic protease family protein [Cyclobacteriaceae bacterium]
MNDWIVVPVTTHDGRVHSFVLDLAATSTVISRSLLPSDAIITKMEMVEYSAGESITKQATMQGATGSIDSNVFMGKYKLSDCLLHNLPVDEINTSVLREFPIPLTEMGIEGILGTDVLSRANMITINGLQDKKGGKVVFGSSHKSSKNELSFPIQMAAGLLFVNGKIDEIPVQLIMDTGARESIITDSFAEEHHLELKVLSTEKQIAGIDGVPIQATTIQITDFKIGDYSFGTQQMILGELGVLQSFGIQKASAILGMDFFRHFTEVSFDLNNQRLFLRK